MAVNAEPVKDEQTPLYVVVPPSPLFAAHWSLFIPDSSLHSLGARVGALPTTGRRIHVSGDRLNGFSLEIIRAYDVRKHRSVGSRQYPIGLIVGDCLREDAHTSGGEEQHQEKDEDDGGGYIDNQPRDAFEDACVQVEAPGPSLNKASNGVRQKVEVRDCQWWIAKVVEALVEKGILGPLLSEDGPEQQSPVARVARLPRN